MTAGVVFGSTKAHVRKKKWGRNFSRTARSMVIVVDKSTPRPSNRVPRFPSILPHPPPPPPPPRGLTSISSCSNDFPIFDTVKMPRRQTTFRFTNVHTDGLFCTPRPMTCWRSSRTKNSTTTNRIWCQKQKSLDSFPAEVSSRAHSLLLTTL